MFLQVSVCPQVGGAIPACIAGGISMPCSRSPRGVVSQHALQVSRPRGEVEGDLAEGGGGGVSRPTPKGEVEGDLARGFSRPTSKGEVEGDLQAHTCGGLLLGGWSAGGGVCSLGERGAWSQGGLCETPPPPTGTATAAGGTHPSGMHSCFF